MHERPPNCISSTGFCIVIKKGGGRHRKGQVPTKEFGDCHYALRCGHGLAEPDRRMRFLSAPAAGQSFFNATTQRRNDAVRSRRSCDPGWSETAVVARRTERSSGAIEGRSLLASLRLCVEN